MTKSLLSFSENFLVKSDRICTQVISLPLRINCISEYVSACFLGAVDNLDELRFGLNTCGRDGQDGGPY